MRPGRRSRDGSTGASPQFLDTARNIAM